MTFNEMVESQLCRMDEVMLAGVRGKSLDEEKELFQKLNGRIDELVAKNADKYLVVTGKLPVPYVGVPVSNSFNLPEDMAMYTIPEGEYVRFRFRKEHIGDFWTNVCTDENQEKYNLEFAKPKFEISTSHLQSTGYIEWYIPTRNPLVDIREYCSSDLEGLTDLMADLGSPSTIEDMKKRMELIEANPFYYTFVATRSDRVVGMIGVRLNGTYTSNKMKTQISSLVTKKKYRGQGIGKALISFIEEWTQSQGSDFLYLTSGMKKERFNAHEFYKKQGFNATGYRFVKRLD